RTLWIEGPEAPRRAELAAIEGLAVRGTNDAQGASALVSASPRGPGGKIRSFCSTNAELAYVSPVIASFDLDGACEQETSADPVIGSGWATVTAPAELGLEEFLAHLQFHFDDDWAAYYRDECETPQMRSAVLRSN